MVLSFTEMGRTGGGIDLGGKEVRQQRWGFAYIMLEVAFRHTGGCISLQR